MSRLHPPIHANASTTIDDTVKLPHYTFYRRERGDNKKIRIVFDEPGREREFKIEKYEDVMYGGSVGGVCQGVLVRLKSSKYLFVGDRIQAYTINKRITNFVAREGGQAFAVDGESLHMFDTERSLYLTQLYDFVDYYKGTLSLDQLKAKTRHRGLYGGQTYHKVVEEPVKKPLWRNRDGKPITDEEWEAYRKGRDEDNQNIRSPY